MRDIFERYTICWTDDPGHASDYGFEILEGDKVVYKDNGYVSYPKQIGNELLQKLNSRQFIIDKDGNFQETK